MTTFYGGGLAGGKTYRGKLMDDERLLDPVFFEKQLRTAQALKEYEKSIFNKKLSGELSQKKEGKKKMKKYIGKKQVQATPADKDGVRGYKVVYADGYESWSPADVFESAYKEIQEDQPVARNTIEYAESLIISQEFFQLSQKISAMITVLKNGYHVLTTASVVDPRNNNMKIGQDICNQKALEKILELESYVQQELVPTDLCITCSKEDN